MDAACNAPFSVKGDVVLNKLKVRNTQCDHLGTLPVLLEPAAAVAVNGEVHHLEAGDASLLHLKLLLEFDVRHDKNSYCP